MSIVCAVDKEDTSAAAWIDHTSLIERVAEGDQSAFAELHSRLRPRLYALALRMVRSATDAEDVMQEAFCTVWRNAAQYQQGRGTSFTWLATIVRHKGIDCLRYRSRDYHRASRATEAFHLNARDPRPGDELAIVTESNAAVHVALSALHANERHVIHLAFFNGLTHPEIATALALPMGTVKARIRRGLGKLRPALREHHRPLSYCRKVKNSPGCSKPPGGRMGHSQVPFSAVLVGTVSKDYHEK